MLRAGKNQDRWFASEDLLAQVDQAIDIFEGHTNGFATGLLFLTMLQVTKNAPLMPFQHVIYPRTLIQRGACTSLMVQKCKQQHSH